MDKPIRYTKPYVKEFQPGKWLPDGNVQMGYDGSAAGKRFIFGWELEIRFRVSQDGVIADNAVISSASRSFELEEMPAWLRLQQVAWMAASMLVGQHVSEADEILAGALQAHGGYVTA